MTQIPSGIHVDGGNGRPYALRIGDHDFSDLLISSSPGPIIETLTPGDPNPLRIAWIPVLFEGAISDPNGNLRIVHSGEMERLL